MPQWSNWSGKLTAQPSNIHFIRSEADAAALAATADKHGKHVRVAGATHSHAPLVKTDEIIADVQGLSGVISASTDDHTAWVAAGTRIYALGRPLQQAGLALVNQGDIDQQAISGATGTGTHGTGVTLKNLSAAVLGAKIALSNGELVECSNQNEPELWQAARLHLGALGIMTQLNLQLRRAFKLKESQWQMSLDEALANFHTDALQHRHHEFFWYPQDNLARGKSINITDDPPVYPLAAEGQRCAWSYEVLPNYRPHKHTEMEYSIPIEDGPACMQAIRDLLTQQFADVRWPVEYRTLAADDVWLSTAYQRDSVTISVHQDIAEDDEPYFRACEEIFLAFNGRPHWGKVHYLSGEQLASCHPRWHDWWRVRDKWDPKGTFLNHYLRQLH